LRVNVWAQHPFEFSEALLLRSTAWPLTRHRLADRVAGGGDTLPYLRGKRLLGPVVLPGAAMLLTTIFAVNLLLGFLASAPRGSSISTWPGSCRAGVMSLSRPGLP